MEPNFQPSVQQLEAILQDPKDSYTYETNDPLRTWVAILIRNALDSWYGKLSPLQIKNSAQVELGKTLIENVLAKGKRDSMVRKQATLCVGKIGKSNLNANLSNLFEDLTLHIQNLWHILSPAVLHSPFAQPHASKVWLFFQNPTRPLSPTSSQCMKSLG
ncbi:hypothetical protein PGTUg99_024150 [Puccinia graminis f. sp. tritici]|uniref:Uncharacterized protein n=1 Tax=Puccinia graminis f. sp. tritici TaxID=56615 RepID=A0A5B0RLJ8_PUCGR|nr:hypothetical protein PGTUg99_024150 [Puccinia graminis f. sp. tritici]